MNSKLLAKCRPAFFRCSVLFIIVALIFSSCSKKSVQSDNIKTVYYEGSSQKELEVYINDSGQFHGPHRTYYRTGELSFERMFRNNTIVDYEKKWFKDGTLEYESEVIHQDLVIVDEGEDGFAEIRALTKLYRSYHKNGQKKSLGFYEKDKRVGVWFYWNELGKLDSTTFYARNE